MADLATSDPVDCSAVGTLAEHFLVGDQQIGR